MRIDGLQYILDRYPEFETEPIGMSRILGQMAYAKASLGDRRGALELAKKTLKLNPKEGRAALAMAVAAGVPSATVVSQLQKRGKSV